MSNPITAKLDDVARWLEAAIREVDLAAPAYDNCRTEALGRVTSARYLVDTAQRMLGEVADRLAPMPELSRAPLKGR